MFGCTVLTLFQAGVPGSSRRLHPSQLHSAVRPATQSGRSGVVWPGGFFRPRHGSKYDLAGRVFQGFPVPNNLPVPPHHFPNDKTLQVGESPPESSFDFNSILQV